MRIKIRLFARLRDICGSGEIVRNLPTGAMVEDVWKLLTDEYPALASHTSSISSALNTEYVKQDAVVHEGDEVAFLPPVSGGNS